MTRRLLALLAALWLVEAPLVAVSVRSWSASTEREFARGTLDGTAVDGEGRVRLAPDFEALWGPGEGVVWAVLPAGDGAAFVALSGPGRLLRVAAGREPEVWYSAADESLVTALAPDGAGGVVFAVSPHGTIHRARSRGGKVEVEKLADTGARFVWGLARESGGRLWVGTGVPGRLLKLDPGGPPETVFESGDDPVRSLALDPGSGLVLGTGGRGRVLRIGADGRAFVVLDADEAEIVALAVTPQGTIYAAAAKAPKQPRPGRPAPTGAPEGATRIVVTATPEDEEREEPEAPAQPPPAAPAPGAPQAFATQPGGSLYRIDVDGMTRKIWETGEEMPFAVAIGPEGLLYVGTGDSGRVWALDAEGRSSRLLRVPSDQVSAMSADPSGRVLVGATTDARVAWTGPAPRREGNYLIPAVDAGSVADWGRLRWDAEVPRGGALRVQARSGNTAEPDDTWSPWADLPDGARGGAAETEVPAARWFQARFVMAAGGGETPLLRQVEISFQPRNRPPTITSVTVDPPGVVWLRGPAQSSFQVGPTVADDPVAREVAASLARGGRGRNAGALRKTYEAGARTFAWTAGDPDGDRLRYSLELRREGTEAWFLLAADLDDEFLSADARAWPDGTYRARLTVHDAADNPNGTHLRVERLSDAFRVDNTRPSVGDQQVERQSRRREVRFVARDPGGSVAAVEVIVDGGTWLPLSPLDGVADSELERYRLVLEADPGEPDAARSVIVRVTDSSGNLGGAMWRIE